MDSLIAAAARALAAGDALGALKRIALREDPPALALRGMPLSISAGVGFSTIVKACLLPRSCAERSEQWFGNVDALDEEPVLRRPATVAVVRRRPLTLSSPYVGIIALARVLRPTARESRTRAMNIAVGQDPPVIEIRDLHKRYDALEVLRGVDLTVPSGSVLALLGSNGAGKTTAVRILSTLLKADGGSARVNGYDVATQAADVRASISLTGQFAAVDEILPLHPDQRAPCWRISGRKRLS